MKRWRFVLERLGSQLWPRAAIYAALGVTVALLAALFARFVPDSLAKPFGGGTVTGLMNILASSLLAVSIFSVTALLAAFTNISQSTTPRAATLVAANRPAQSALSTFVGAFLYAVVGYSALGTGYYAEGGRAILFFVTLIVLAIVAVTLLRWVDHLLKLARVENAITAVEHETLKAIEGVFGAASPRTIDPPRPAHATTILAGEVGYVQNVDIETLRHLAEEHKLEIWVRAAPGYFTVPAAILAALTGQADEGVRNEVRQAFSLGGDRSFTQDPEFGFIVLGEIAAKALSPGINNPGVAKDVITSVVRLLDRWMTMRECPSSDAGGRVRWCGPTFEKLIQHGLLPVATNCSTAVTVAMRLQSVLAALQHSASEEDRRVIADFAQETLDRSERDLDHEPDKARIRQARHSLPDLMPPSI